VQLAELAAHQGLMTPVAILYQRVAFGLSKCNWFQGNVIANRTRDIDKMQGSMSGLPRIDFLPAEIESID